WRGKDNKTRQGPLFPATYISWNDIQKFLSKLNARDDQYIYSLPSSAQWEHACRAGSQDIYSFGDDSTALKAFAWYYFNTVEQKQLHPQQVGQKLPNKWGIYDLHGNVAEWVSDHKITGEVIGTGGVISNPRTIASDADQRVARGSYFHQYAKSSGVESYFEFSPDMKHAGLGFRLIRKPTIKRSNLDD
ncbi:MAG: formylglycine-generating enzyme family protein, partial [Rhodothermales bacterium]